MKLHRKNSKSGSKGHTGKTPYRSNSNNFYLYLNLARVPIAIALLWKKVLAFKK